MQRKDVGKKYRIYHYNIFFIIFSKNCAKLTCSKSANIIFLGRNAILSRPNIIDQKNMLNHIFLTAYFRKRGEKNIKKYYFNSRLIFGAYR